MRKLPIRELIISLFLKDSSLSVKVIYQKLNKPELIASQRAIYKELNLLCKEGAIVKNRSVFSLSVTWILAKLDFYKSLFNTFTAEMPVHALLSRHTNGNSKQVISWKFNDLELLDRFWLQLIFSLFEKSSSRQMYAWVPYFWFDLVHLHKDLEAQTAMLLRKNHMYVILGSDTYLERLPVKYWDKKAYTWSYAKSPFEGLNDTYYDVIDDWIITVRINPATTGRIEEFLNSFKNIRDMDRVNDFKSIARNANCRISIENNPAKAQRLLKKFRDFFG